MTAASPVTGDVAAAAGHATASPTYHRIRHHPPALPQGYALPLLSVAAPASAAEASVAANFEQR